MPFGPWGDSISVTSAATISPPASAVGWNGSALCVTRFLLPFCFQTGKVA